MTETISLRVGPNESDNERLGELLRQLRVDTAGLTQVQAAERLHISSEYIRLFEKGQRVPPAGRFVVILDVYEVPYELHREKDHYAVSVGEYRIAFTSRIREVRRSTPKQARYLLTQVDRQRKELLGEILVLATQADERTLFDIRNQLRGD